MKKIIRRHLPIEDEPDTLAGRALSGVTQFMVGFKGFDKALKGIAAATKVRAIAKSLATSAASNFTMFDGQEKRLSNLIQSVPELANPINEYLAAKPGDGKVEGRLKNALEGLGLGVTSEALLHGLSLTKIGRDIQREAMAAYEKKKADGAITRAEARKRGEKLQGDYTDTRSPDLMAGEEQRLKTITPTEKDRLFVGGKTGGYSEREARVALEVMQREHGVNASVVEASPGKWALRVDSVPPPKSAKELAVIVDDLYAATKRGESKTVPLGVVGPEEAARVKAETGKDILLHRRSISAKDVEHAMERHNRQAVAIGEKPLSLPDIVKYVEISSSPDYIHKGTHPTSIVLGKR